MGQGTGVVTRTTICAVGPTFLATVLSATCAVRIVSPIGNCSGSSTKRQYCRTPLTLGVGGGGELRKLASPPMSFVQLSFATVVLWKNRAAKP